MAKQKTTVTLDSLLQANQPIYVMNRSSNPRGNVTITCFRPDGNPFLITIPKTWVPICVTDQVSPETVKNSDDFRRQLQNGMLQLLSLDEAKERLSDPDAEEELTRLNVSKYSSFEGDLKAIDTVDDFSQSVETVDTINLQVREILGREISDTEKYHLLRAEEDLLKNDDFKYIALHAEGKAKEWAEAKL